VLSAKRALGVAVLLLAYASMVAHAHKPVAIGETYATFGEALRLDEIDVSQVAYAGLDEMHRALWLAFDIATPTKLDLSLGIPVIQRLVNYRPNLAVLGPGPPPIDLPLETPEDGGVLFETATAGEVPSFYEPFTGTESWILLETSVDLPQAGVYYVVAWAPNDLPDKLWVAVGAREQFGVSDFLSLGSIIRQVRTFHEIAPRRSSSASAGRLLFLGLFAALLALLVSVSRN